MTTKTTQSEFVAEIKSLIGREKALIIDEGLLRMSKVSMFESNVVNENDLPEAMRLLQAIFGSKVQELIPVSVSLPLDKPKWMSMTSFEMFPYCNDLDPVREAMFGRFAESTSLNLGEALNELAEERIGEEFYCARNEEIYSIMNDQWEDSLTITRWLREIHDGLDDDDYFMQGVAEAFVGFIIADMKELANAVLDLVKFFNFCLPYGQQIDDKAKWLVLVP